MPRNARRFKWIENVSDWSHWVVQMDKCGVSYISMKIQKKVKLRFNRGKCVSKSWICHKIECSLHFTTNFLLHNGRFPVSEQTSDTFEPLTVRHFGSQLTAIELHASRKRENLKEIERHIFQLPISWPVYYLCAVCPIVQHIDWKFRFRFVSFTPFQCAIISTPLTPLMMQSSEGGTLTSY